MNFLDTKGLAAALNLKVSTVQRWSRLGLIPVIRMGHRTRLYNLDSVRAAILQHEDFVADNWPPGVPLFKGVFRAAREIAPK